MKSIKSPDVVFMLGRRLYDDNNRGETSFQTERYKMLTSAVECISIVLSKGKIILRGKENLKDHLEYLALCSPNRFICLLFVIPVETPVGLGFHSRIVTAVVG